MNKRPRRRARGNITPAALVRFDDAKQRLFVEIADKRKINIATIAELVDLSEGLVVHQLRRLGWKRSSVDRDNWFLP